MAARGQSVRGVVVDENAAPVSYAKIGVKGLPGGTLSDGEGRFELSLADSLGGERNVSFSHLSYLTAERTIAELQRLSASKEPVEITMASRPTEIAEVVVLPFARTHRYVGRGFPVPGYGAIVRSEKEADSRRTSSAAAKTDSNLGEEIGSRLEIGKLVRLTKIRFKVLSSTFDNVKFRVNVYRANPETARLENILRDPIYYDIPPGRKNRRIEIAPVEDVVLEPGEYHVMLEFVEPDGYGEIRFPISLRKSYARHSSMEEFEQIPVCIGIAVEGVEIAR